MLASVWSQIGKYVHQQHLQHDHGCSGPLSPPEPGPAFKTVPASIYLLAALTSLLRVMLGARLNTE